MRHSLNVAMVTVLREWWLMKSKLNRGSRELWKRVIQKGHACHPTMVTGMTSTGQG